MNGRDIFLMAVVFAVGFLVAQQIYTQPQISTEREVVQVIKSIELGENITRIEIYAPAVDREGNGVVTKVEVIAMPGTGKILTNIDSILFWVDTQDSIRTARNVAQDVTGLDLSEYDIIYAIDANATVIEGPSAGAALTIATIAAVQNSTLNDSVVITGTIEPNGRIGSVGGIPEKALAAKRRGASLFLVPEGFSGLSQKTFRETKCFTTGSTRICQIQYVTKNVGLEEDIGIAVQPVSNIKQALEYFIE